MGILPPLVDEFLKDKKIPESWGDENDGLKAAHFMAYAAAKPTALESGPLLTSVQCDAETKRNYFCDLFTAEPDFALRLMLFVRKKLQVGGGASNLGSAIAFLREGATARFAQKAKREPTDKDLSEMIKVEFGLNISSEVFGDARRIATKDDEKTGQIRRQLKGRR